MAKETYETALKNVLRHEGGYTNHPADPGGPTNYGITIYDYRLYINKNGTAQDVRNMSLEQAKKIYRSKYWDIMHCDALPAGVDYTVFDVGVNSGVGRAAEFLRQALNLPISPKTITSEIVVAASKAKPQDLIYGINDLRLKFLKRLRIWGSFGRGWTRRVNEVRALSLELASPAYSSSSSNQV